MNKNFTYIIRSNDREEPIDDSNNCTIQLNGLPQQYRHFKCDVIGLEDYIINNRFLFDLECISPKGKIFLMNKDVNFL